MEEKIFSFLEKLYIEMQDMRSEMNDMKSEMNDMKSTMATKKDLEKLATKEDLVRLESELKDDIRGLYDGYEQCIEGINDVKVKVDQLAGIVENHELRLQVLESTK